MAGWKTQLKFASIYDLLSDLALRKSARPCGQWPWAAPACWEPQIRKMCQPLPTWYLFPHFPHVIICWSGNLSSTFILEYFTLKNTIAKTLVLGKIEGRRKRGQQRVRWVNTGSGRKKGWNNGGLERLGFLKNRDNNSCLENKNRQWFSTLTQASANF